MKTPGISAPQTSALLREHPAETATPARQAPARPTSAKTRPDAALNGLAPRVKGPRTPAPAPRAAGLTKSQAQLQTLAQKGRPVSAEALAQADEDALQAALLASMQSAPRHAGAMSGQQAGIVGGQAAGFNVGSPTIEQANHAALREGLVASGARPLPPIPTGPRTSGAQPLQAIPKGSRPLPPIPTGPRPAGSRPAAQSSATMTELQARIVDAQLAGRPMTPRTLEHANDAALAAALQESFDSAAHDSPMTPHQAAVLDALEAGHDVDADALQIADDEALARAIAQSINGEQGAHPMQHAAPDARPEHAPSRSPHPDVAAQMKSMQDLQHHQMAMTHAQNRFQASTEATKAMTKLTS